MGENRFTGCTVAACGMGGDVEFSLKKNLAKAGLAALVAGVSAGAFVAVDALEKGEVDLKKVAIGVAVATVAAAAKSLHNFLKNAII